MTTQEDEPNEYGFGGGATAPQPEPEHDDALHEEAEEISVPRDDLTSPIGHALQELGGTDDDEE